MNKLRILMVIGQYFPIIGGAQGQAKKLAESLVCCGSTVTILTIHQKGLQEKENINGVNVIRLWGLLGKDIKRLHLMIRIFFFILSNRNKYDIIHIHQGIWPAVPAVLAASLIKKPSIIKVGNSGHMLDFKLIAKDTFFINIFYKMIKQQVTKVVCITCRIYSELKVLDFSEDKLIKIPNGVIINSFQKMSVVAREKIRLVYHGRLSENKNLELAINAISLSKNRGRLIFEIFGSGKNKDVLKNLIIKRNLSEVVYIRDSVADVSPILEKADIFLLPSKVEGLSNSLLEAMSYGLIPLVSDIPSNKEVLAYFEDSNRLLLPLNTSGAESVWAERIDYFIENNNEMNLLSNEIRSYANNYFSMKKITDQYLDLYRNLINS
jgi:glycosyltransferase involved in cell wall biosynthesis